MSETLFSAIFCSFALVSLICYIYFKLSWSSLYSLTACNSVWIFIALIFAIITIMVTRYSFSFLFLLVCSHYSIIFWMLCFFFLPPFILYNILAQDASSMYLCSVAVPRKTVCCKRHVSEFGVPLLYACVIMELCYIIWKLSRICISAKDMKFYMLCWNENASVGMRLEYTGVLYMSCVSVLCSCLLLYWIIQKRPNN